MRKVFVDYRINEIELEALKKLRSEVIKCPPSKILYDAVCGHPDMLMQWINVNHVIIQKDMPVDFINKLENYNLKITLSNNSLKTSYPYDIILNAVNTDELFIHNLAYTDPILLMNVKHKKLINVKQGYTKCSTVILNKKSFITSDISISKALESEGYDVLLLPPGDIVLPGLDYGFIGGTCGLLDNYNLAFYGSLEHYKYGKEVKNFLKKYKIEPIYLREGKLIDRGSIFCIE